MLQRIAIGVCVLAIVASAAAQPAPNRVSTSEKGSFLLFAKVDVRRDAATLDIVQDTFVQLTNDFEDLVKIKMYYIYGDDCSELDQIFFLTPDHPMYFSCATGQPGPLGAALTPYINGGTWMPDPYHPDWEMIQGYIIAYAIESDSLSEPRVYNYLTGKVTIVNYDLGAAWEYNPYHFSANGGSLSSPVFFDGISYDQLFKYLVLDFFAADSTALSGGGLNVVVNTELTLLPVVFDVRQDHCHPFCTKARFDIWNENELGISGATWCVCCFGNDRIGNIHGNFTQGSLQTNRGFARIWSDWPCVTDPNAPGMPCDPITCLLKEEPAPFLGVAMKEITFQGATETYGLAGSTLVGAGIWQGCPPWFAYDSTGGGDEKPTPVEPSETTKNRFGQSVMER